MLSIEISKNYRAITCNTLPYKRPTLLSNRIKQQAPMHMQSDVYKKLRCATSNKIKQHKMQGIRYVAKRDDRGSRYHITINKILISVFFFYWAMTAGDRRVYIWKVLNTIAVCLRFFLLHAECTEFHLQHQIEKR